MFIYNPIFNQILSFDTSGVADMATMFYECLAFDQLLELREARALNEEKNLAW